MSVKFNNFALTLWSFQISLEFIFWHKAWKDYCPWCESQIWLQLQWVSYSVPEHCPSDLLCLTQEFCLMNRENHSKQESRGDRAFSCPSPESWNHDIKGRKKSCVLVTGQSCPQYLGDRTVFPACASKGKALFIFWTSSQWSRNFYGYVLFSQCNTLLCKG